MTIKPRGNSLQIDVKVGAKDNPTGQPVRVRTTARTEPDAIRLEQEIRDSIRLSGRWVPGNKATMPGEGSLRAALELAWNCKTGRNRGWLYQRSGMTQYKRALECIEWLGPERHCSTVTGKDLDRVLAHMIDTGNTPVTAAYKVQALSRVLYHAERAEWTTARPSFERPSAARVREFIFTPQLEAKLLDWCVARGDVVFRDMVVIAIETGMRVSELLQTIAENWDVENGVVRVAAVHSKSGKARTIRLSDRAIAVVRPRVVDPGQSPRARLFHTSRTSVAAKMRAARDALGYSDEPDFTFHALRHTYATRLAGASRDPFAVQVQMGHGSILTSMRYIKLAGVA